jgi:hypothetical protein
VLSLRIRNDTAYLFIRQAPSEADARTWLETEGKRFREPVAVLVSGGDEAPMRLPPTKLMHRPWTMQSQWHAELIRCSILNSSWTPPRARSLTRDDSPTVFSP